MWIATRDMLPSENGYYLVQSIYGEIYAYEYTVAGGWNTHYNHEGELRNINAINDGYVARWFDNPKPEPIPQEWKDEYTERG